MPGPKPKPKAINDLKGDPSNRRKNKVEPQASKDKPDCPSDLGDIAKAEWNFMTEQLDQMGLLSLTDKASLEMYCSAFERYKLAEADVKKNGSQDVSPKNGYPINSLAYNQMHKELDVCRRFQAEFGMTPSSRSKLAVQKDATKNNTLLNFVNKKKS